MYLRPGVALRQPKAPGSPIVLAPHSRRTSISGYDLILLLAGGDKASQSKDIAAAKHYWKDFTEAKHGKAQ
jgi:putative component of toxin-antitoxin plasmid stabilization module